MTASISFTLPGGPGLRITATQLEDGRLRIDAGLTSAGSLVADLRGLFFHIGTESLLAGLQITGAQVTGQQVLANGVSTLTAGVSMVGAARPFDAGVLLGSASAAGADDIRSTTLFVGHATQALTLDLLSRVQFGAVLGSVGADGGPRVGLVKLSATAPAVNAAPLANADSFSVAEDQSVTMDVLANDRDANLDPLSIVSFTQPSAGTVVRDGTALRFQAAGGFDALAAGQSTALSFSYRIEDGRGGSATAAVNVTVEGVNDAPIAAAQAGAVTEDDPARNAASGSLLTGALDPDAGSALGVVSVGGAANGPVSGVYGTLAWTPGTGAYTYTLDNSRPATQALVAGQEARDDFSFTLGDGLGGSSSNTLRITVSGADEAVPVAGLQVAASAPAFDSGTRPLGLTPDGLTLSGGTGFSAASFTPRAAVISGWVPLAPGSTSGVYTSTAPDVALPPGRDGLADAILFNAATGVTTLLDPSDDGLPGAMISMPVGTLPDGRILTLAVNERNAPTSQSVHLYDPSTGDFSFVPGSSPTLAFYDRAYALHPTSSFQLGESIGLATSHGQIPFLAGDGATVADTDGRRDAFLFDIATGAVTALDVLPNGTVGNGSSGFAFDEETGSPFSPDGRWVFFTSLSNNLGLPDTQHSTTDADRVMLVARNTLTGALVRVDSRADGQPAVDTSSGGDQAQGSARFFVPLSGNRVLFSSDDRLVDGMTGANAQLFIKDLDSGAVELITTKPDGTPAIASSTALRPLFDLTRPLAYQISPIHWKGNDFIFIQTQSADLQPNPDNAIQLAELFIKNLTTGALTELDLRADGAFGSTSDTLLDSGDANVGGGRVLFTSRQNGIVSGDNDGFEDAFLADLTVGNAARRPTLSLDLRADGSQPTVNSFSQASWIGADTFIVRTRSDLLAADTDGLEDHYIVKIDFENGARTVTALDSRPDGTPVFTADDFVAFSPTAEAGWVTFKTTAALLPTDTDALPDTYLKNVFTRETVQLTRAEPQGSSDGTFSFLFALPALNLPAAFAGGGWFGLATDNGLAAGDTDGQSDLYIVSRFGDAPVLLDRAADGSNGNGRSDFIAGSGFVDDEWVLFGSTSTNLVPGVGNGSTMLQYLKNRVTGQVVPGVLSASGAPADPGAAPGIFSATGAGGTLAGQVLQHSQVQLTENDLNGRIDTYLRDPAAMVEAWTQGQVNQVTLTARAAGATAFAFAWGDGQSEAMGAVGGEAAAAHVYASGTHTATVTATTPTGLAAFTLSVVAGSAAADTLADTSGATALTGGLDDDRFVFTPGHGQDTIAGFGPGDVVALAAFGTRFDTFGEIMAATNWFFTRLLTYRPMARNIMPARNTPRYEQTA